MDVGIDISGILYGTGVSRYTKSLVESILKSDSQDELTLFGGSLRRISELRGFFSTLSSKKARASFFPFPPVAADFVWNRLHTLPVETLIGNQDVFHSSDWAQPPTKAFKVTTIHDLVPIIYPGSFIKDSLRDVVAVHKRRYGWIKKEVDMIIAVSKSTKADIVKYLAIDPKRIKVVYEAAGSEFTKRSRQEVASIKKKFNINGDYLLVVGWGERKNIDKIYEAMLMLPKSFPKTLVVVTAAEVRLRKGLIVANASNSELAALYSGATSLVYASLYEGFGLPILEAFGCECPVVTSNISSMPEVAGDAAVLVDPRSVESISEGIKTAIKSKENIVKSGLIRRSLFSWENAAKETLEIYRMYKK